MPTGEFIRALVFVGCVGAVYYLAAKYLWLTILWRKRGQQPPVSATRARRVFFVLAGFGLLCLAYAYFVEPYWPEVTHVHIASTHLRPGTALRIVHISDLHAGAKQRLEPRLPDLIAAEKPDLIVFTGDTGSSRDDSSSARELFQKLSATAPVYGVRGNWDAADVFAGKEVHELDGNSAALEIRGNQVQLAGAGDGSDFLIPAALRTMQTYGFRILLYHRPDKVEQVAALHLADLYCAGHTHGGQVALPWYGAIVTLTKTGKKYESGLYRVGDTFLYVNRGIGMEPDLPIRFFARPEITVIDVSGQQP